MGLKSHKPYTPSRRHMVLSDFADITKSTPERSLLKGKKSMAGRNSAGRISVRHKGGGHKRRYRRMDEVGTPYCITIINYYFNLSSICFATSFTCFTSALLSSGRGFSSRS